MHSHRLVVPNWSLPLTPIASLDEPSAAVIAAQHRYGDCTVLTGTQDAADLWNTLRDRFQQDAIPFNWYTPDTLVQHCPTADALVRTFALSPSGDPLIPAGLLDANPATRQRCRLFPHLQRDRLRNEAMVTPQG